MGGDHFNEPVNQFGSKTGTVHIELLREKIVDLFHVRRNRLGIGRRGEGFQFLLQAGDLVVCLFAKGLVFLSWQFAVCTHGSVVQLALFDFSIWLRIGAADIRVMAFPFWQLSIILQARRMALF